MKRARPRSRRTDDGGARDRSPGGVLSTKVTDVAARRINERIPLIQRSRSFPWGSLALLLFLDPKRRNRNFLKTMTRAGNDVDAAARQADASVPVFHDYSLSSDFER